jgi:hypothetical protein
MWYWQHTEIKAKQIVMQDSDDFEFDSVSVNGTTFCVT